MFAKMKFLHVIGAVALAELILGIFIIEYVPYTEIDWKAYMQEVEGFLGGDLDYMNLRGDTGPLVYPAGFVYFFALLRSVTGGGLNIRLAQYAFLGFYLISVASVATIYHRTDRVPQWFLLLICCSRRLHSIFMLRLFNDPIALMFLWFAVLCFQSDKWSIGCLLFSFAVSIKMNVLLFAPGLFFLLVERFGFIGTMPKLGICAAVQLLLGAPFLLAYPLSYIGRAFEFSRVFMFKWTVNFKFLSPELFVSKQLALALLAAHLLFLILFAHFRWCRQHGGLIGFFRAFFSKRVESMNQSAATITAVLFESNFIGIVFCRSIHYQFYSWYFFTLPFLLASIRIPSIFKLLLLAGIEFSYNIYPAQPFSSLCLQFCHLAILLLLLFRSVSPRAVPVVKSD